MYHPHYPAPSHAPPHPLSLHPHHAPPGSSGGPSFSPQFSTDLTGPRVKVALDSVKLSLKDVEKVLVKVEGRDAEVKEGLEGVLLRMGGLAEETFKLVETSLVTLNESRTVESTQAHERTKASLEHLEVISKLVKSLPGMITYTRNALNKKAESAEENFARVVKEEREARARERAEEGGGSKVRGDEWERVERELGGRIEAVSDRLSSLSTTLSPLLDLLPLVPLVPLLAQFLHQQNTPVAQPAHPTPPLGSSQTDRVSSLSHSYESSYPLPPAGQPQAQAQSQSQVDQVQERGPISRDHAVQQPQNPSASFLPSSIDNVTITCPPAHDAQSRTPVVYSRAAPGIVVPNSQDSSKSLLSTPSISRNPAASTSSTFPIKPVPNSAPASKTLATNDLEPEHKYKTDIEIEIDNATSPHPTPSLSALQLAPSHPSSDRIQPPPIHTTLHSPLLPTDPIHLAARLHSFEHSSPIRSRTAIESFAANDFTPAEVVAKVTGEEGERERTLSTAGVGRWSFMKRGRSGGVVVGGLGAMGGALKKRRIEQSDDEDEIGDEICGEQEEVDGREEHGAGASSVGGTGIEVQDQPRVGGPPKVTGAVTTGGRKKRVIELDFSSDEEEEEEGFGIASVGDFDDLEGGGEEDGTVGMDQEMEEEEEEEVEPDTQDDE